MFPVTYRGGAGPETVGCGNEACVDRRDRHRNNRRLGRSRVRFRDQHRPWVSVSGGFFFFLSSSFFDRALASLRDDIIVRSRQRYREQSLAVPLCAF